MDTAQHIAAYTLRMADNALILGHRLSEWCGHGPFLEQDIAMTNIALDLTGQAQSLYAYAAEEYADGRTEDDLAYLRDVPDFKNILLVELPNGDFAHTVVRQLFFSAFQHPFYQALCHSADATLKGVAAKAVKETAYHLRWAGEWVVRLGDGTEESRQRTLTALDTLWPYSAEAMMPDVLDVWAAENGIGPDLSAIRTACNQTLTAVLTQATLPLPDDNIFMQTGGKTGLHTEALGYLLAEMQFLQRAYPNSEW